jgi:hypothetical protein
MENSIKIMRLQEFLNEGWVFPDDKTLKADFSEYKKKEDRKWRHRVDSIGARFPLFNDFNHFKQSLRDAETINLRSGLDNQIQNRSHSSSIESLKSLVSSYVRPRDVDRIVQGIESGASMPMPIVLKGSRGMWIMAGNTRLDTAFILGNMPKVLMVDVSE